MKKEKKRESKPQNYRFLIWLLGGIVGQIVVFVGGNYASALFSPNPIEALVVSGILVILGLIAWTLVTFLSWSLIAPTKGAAERKKILSDKSQSHNTTICDKNECICCLSKALKSSELQIEVAPDLKEKCRLFSKQEIYEKERDGSDSGNKWTNVWIFSEDLASELESNNEAEPVVIKNITNHRTHYSMFYLDSDRHRVEIAKRKAALLDSIRKSEFKRNLSFYPLAAGVGYIGKNTLPLLCGSILFSDWNDETGLPVFNEGYLSMRKDVKDNPIYYKMPYCMLKQYATYFKQIAKNN